MHVLAERFVFWGWWFGFSERVSQDLSNCTNVGLWLAIYFFSLLTSIVYGSSQIKAKFEISNSTSITLLKFPFHNYDSQECSSLTFLTFLILFVVLEGRVYYVNEHGGCAEVVTADGAIKRLLYHEARDLLVVVTEGMVLSQFSVDTDGMLTEITKVSRLPLLTPRSPIIGQVS